MLFESYIICLSLMNCDSKHLPILHFYNLGLVCGTYNLGMTIKERGNNSAKKLQTYPITNFQ